MRGSFRDTKKHFKRTGSREILTLRNKYKKSLQEYFKNKNIKSNITNTYVNLIVDNFSNYIVDLIKKNILK